MRDAAVSNPGVSA